MLKPSHIEINNKNITLMDLLYCQEERLDELLEEEAEKEETTMSLSLEEREDLLYHLCSLSSKEAQTNPNDNTLLHGYLVSGARTETIAWVTRAVSKHGFNTQTFLLAVNYLDRCFLNGTLQLQSDKPWMSKLVSLACLSLAAKVEETQVPLILDLQMAVMATDETGTNGTADTNVFVFEAKTVRRMEFLVLSALEWRLNPVTALSFVQTLISLLCSEKEGRNLTAKCEAIIVSVLADWRWVNYNPSMWAVATLLHVLDIEKSENLMSLINVSKTKVQECFDVISEQIINAQNQKRKYLSSNMLYNSMYEYFSPPLSPNAVINASFSCDNSSNSGDSWSRVSSVSSSPDPFRPLKRACSDCSSNRSLLLGDEESREPWEFTTILD